MRIRDIQVASSCRDWTMARQRSRDYTFRTFIPPSDLYYMYMGG